MNWVYHNYDKYKDQDEESAEAIEKQKVKIGDNNKKRFEI